jgi:hypothetical protein
VNALSVLQRRLDREALNQLRGEAARLIAENDALRERLAYAEDAAMSWRDDALDLQLQLCAQVGGKPAITVDGSLGVVA